MFDTFSGPTFDTFSVDLTQLAALTHLAELTHLAVVQYRACLVAEWPARRGVSLEASRDVPRLRHSV